MLFNSYTFILLFLPIAAGGFYLCAPRSHELAALWLATTSLFFYAWWNPKIVLLLCASIVFNFLLGRIISARRDSANGKTLLTLAIAANLALLVYYKYVNFFITTSNAIVGTGFELTDIVLPLGISFFTFTQIAFLVDTYRGLASEYRFIHYVLFVTYFPHLIAGPILHHRQIMPQFGNPAIYRFDADRIAVGLTIFGIGLAKKVLIADRLAPYANGIFETAQNGGLVTLFEAWIGALAYTFQLYFDFSGYSDMAIGASCMFGVSLPLNFNSPYKARNITEFWRCWHMTLSEFLRNYLYIPLGGNKLGPLRRYVNLMATMILGGLWHGASWTFVAWGALHGVYLVINHAWQAVMPPPTAASPSGFAQANFFSVGLTFFAVVLAWVLFRAESFAGATIIYKGMLGFGGISLPPYVPEKFGAIAAWLQRLGVTFNGIAPVTNFSMRSVCGLLAVSTLICFALPNTQQFMHRYMPGQDNEPKAGRIALLHLEWRPTLAWSSVFALLCGVSFLGLTQATHFLYFQF